jgi:hypothetical protein
MCGGGEGPGGAARAYVSNVLIREAPCQKEHNAGSKKAQDPCQIVDAVPYQLFDPRFIYVYATGMLEFS